MDAVLDTGWLKNMLHHGYAAFVVERPGTGASFGRLDPSFEVGASEANANPVLGAVTCSGKLSLVVEYAEEAVESATMEKIKDKAMGTCLKSRW